MANKNIIKNYFLGSQIGWPTSQVVLAFRFRKQYLYILSDEIVSIYDVDQKMADDQLITSFKHEMSVTDLNLNFQIDF